MVAQRLQMGAWCIQAICVCNECISMLCTVLGGFFVPNAFALLDQWSWSSCNDTGPRQVQLYLFVNTKRKRKVPGKRANSVNIKRRVPGKMKKKALIYTVTRYVKIVTDDWDWFSKTPFHSNLSGVCALRVLRFILFALRLNWPLMSTISVLQSGLVLNVPYELWCFYSNLYHINS